MDLSFRPLYLIISIRQAGLDINCSRCNFRVLNWNQSSIDFYESQGAFDLTKAEGWHTFRFKFHYMILFSIK
jgi:hypothetical protein